MCSLVEHNALVRRYINLSKKTVKIRPSFLTSFRGSIYFTRGMEMQEAEAEQNRWRVCVFVSVNITSLFTVHWSLFMQGLV